MSVQQGGTVVLNVTPLAGYRIVKLVVDGVDVGAVSSYTFNNVQRSHEVGAYFDKGAAPGAKAAAASVKNGVIPQTSDESPLGMLVLLMVVSLGALTVMVIRRKKKQ